MSFVRIAPQMAEAAAADLARIGASVNAANAVAAGSTSVVLAAGADEVSSAIAAFFGTHAREYQALNTQVAEFHERFVQTLTSGARSYAAAEAFTALDLVNAPSQALLGRPLIGNGADGAAGTGQAGGSGGLLWGNG
ncbi:PE family protein, partial [Mycobacterium gordonae]|uniref:PE family protein n=3 Tax=Mycobacteriaceae TaxID=1762 RepID=UPI000AAE9F15